MVGDRSKERGEKVGALNAGNVREGGEYSFSIRGGERNNSLLGRVSIRGGKRGGHREPPPKKRKDQV